MARDRGGDRDRPAGAASTAVVLLSTVRDSRVGRRVKFGPCDEDAVARPRLSVGVASILDRSGRVSRAFGQKLGFILMVLAIFTGAGIGAGAVVLIAKGLGRFVN
jgi:hypothetical protein